MSIELKLMIRNVIGPFAQPDAVVLVQSLPKTRSGKIMRRILRKVSLSSRLEYYLHDFFSRDSLPFTRRLR